jgi:hypothetical protein
MAKGEGEDEDFGSADFEALTLRSAAAPHSVRCLTTASPLPHRCLTAASPMLPHRCLTAASPMPHRWLRVRPLCACRYPKQAGREHRGIVR